MPIGRPPTVNTLWVPGGISATGATTYLFMAWSISRPHAEMGERRGAIAPHSSELAHGILRDGRPCGQSLQLNERVASGMAVVAGAPSRPAVGRHLGP